MFAVLFLNAGWHALHVRVRKQTPGLPAASRNYSVGPKRENLSNCRVHGAQGTAVEAVLLLPHACTHAHAMPSKGPVQTLPFLPALVTRGSVACDSVVSLFLSPNRPPLFSIHLPRWYVFYKDISLWIILRFFHIRSHIQDLGFGGGWGHPTYCAIRYYLACTAPPNLQAQT